MSIRILKKALGLLIVDIVIIIGIFVLQFRTDSNIIKKIGNLQITLAGAEGEDGSSVYKNKLRVSYNGINFFCDDQNPAVIKKDGNQLALTLIDCEQPDDLSFTIKFTEGVKVTFELASLESDSSLAVVTEFPSEVSSFLLPYNYSANMRLQKSEADHIILDAKRTSWELSAYSLDAGYSEFNKREYVATYAVYDENQKFTFDSIIDLPIASADEYSRNISLFKKNLIATYDSNNVTDNITEQVAVSYIAAMAENGNYSRALENVPDNVKKSRQRTYLSAPYFNTLEDMNTSLEKTIKDYERRISDGADRDNLDLFIDPNLADFIYIYPGQNTVIKLLQKASTADVETLSIAQITGILRVYVELTKLKPAYASVLEPILEGCVQRITDSCKFEGNILTISENDTFLSVVQAVETGISLLRYGTAVHDDTLRKAGYALVNSYLSESTSFDLRTLSNLYPILAYDNIYYPHLEKISESNGIIWAWTCAKSIYCKRDSEEINLTIDFPEGDTHYLIIKGIPQFNTIYIYDMAFRTDPRFETYNSSGYVYKKNTETLLLKSRHKKQMESIRLVYRENKPEPAPVPVVTEPSPSPAPAPVETVVPVEAAAPAITPAAPAGDVENSFEAPSVE